MNKNFYRVVWSCVRAAWIVIDARARTPMACHRSNRRRHQAIAMSLSSCLIVEALLPLAAFAQGAPTLTPTPVAQPQNASWEHTLASQAQALAHAQATRQPGAQFDRTYLKREAQTQLNNALQSSVELARESGLPFLRNLQGSLRYDFDRGRSALQLNTIDELFRFGAHSTLLQLGAHNQNERPTTNLGLVYRHFFDHTLMLGANAFLDYEFSKQHLRASLGLEAVASAFSLYGNIYLPLTSWRGAKHNQRRQERPASGADFGIKYRPAFAPELTFKTAYFRWNGAHVDYFDNGQTQRRASGFKYGIDYHPVPLINLALEQTQLVGGQSQTSIQLGLAINLSEPLFKQLRRPASQEPAFAWDSQRLALVEREQRIVLNTRRKIVILPLSVGLLTTDSSTGRITVSGDTQPLARITLRLPDGSSGLASADAQGRYTYTSSQDQPSGVLVVRARNDQGDLSHELRLPYVDPVRLNELNVAVLAMIPSPANRALKVSGKTTPKMNIMVTFPNGESVAAVSDKLGAFQVHSTQAVAQGEVKVQASDPTTRKEAYASVPYTPPTVIAPTIEAVTTDALTGQVTVSGQAEPNTEVILFFPDASLSHTRVDALGNYRSTSAADIPSGELRVERAAKPGEPSAYYSQHYDDKIDKTPPTAPSAPYITTNPDNGLITLVGTAEPHANITVTFPDGSTQTILTDDQGKYRLTSLKDMPAGTLTIVATDSAGNQSPATTQDYADTVDKTAPLLTLSNATTLPDNGHVTVNGTSEAHAEITVHFTDGSSQTTTANDDGNYHVTSTSDLPSGMIRATAVDAHGNRSNEVTLAYIDTVDKTPPSAPSVGGITADTATGQLTLSGRAEPKATISVTFPGSTKPQHATADADGNYRITSDNNVPSGDITLQARDLAGNISTTTTHTYIDGTAPQAPSITRANADPSGRVTLSGLAEPLSTLTVIFPNGEKQTTLAANNGAYTLTSSGNIPSGLISAQARDRAGNDSTSTEYRYTDTTPPPLTLDHVSTDPTTGLVTVTGTTEPGATVAVHFPNGDTIAAEVDAHGNYVVTSAADIGSGPLIAAAIDAAANHATQITYNYIDSIDKTAPAITIASVSASPSDGRLTVSGNTEAGARVTLHFPDGQTVSGMANASGLYTLISPADVTSSGNIRATAADAHDNISPEALWNYLDIIDKTAPVAPRISTVSTDPTTGRVTLSGNAEAAATVTVRFPDATSTTTTATAEGRFTVTSEKDIDSGPIIANATDAAGNTSRDTIYDYVDSVDVTAPSAPLISTVTTAEATGIVSVSGTAEAYSIVTLTFPDGSTQDVNANALGAYLGVSAKDQPSGDITARARDAAGNRSDISRHAYSDTVDKTPPLPPSAPTISTDPESGRITLTGMTEPGSTVSILFPDGTRSTTIAADDGRYTASSERDMPSGTLTLNATDKAGNKSPDTRYDYTDTVDKTPPAITITAITTNPATGLATVTGTTEALAQVRISFPDGTHKTVDANADGLYSATSDNDIASGIISVNATDAHGNTSANLSQHYNDTVDKTPPEAPTIASVTTDTSGGFITITGSAEPNSTVLITFPDASTGTATASASGAFSLNSSKSMPNGEIRAIARDAAANRSPTTTISYTDTTPPIKPTIAVTTDVIPSLVTVTGKTEPGARVSLTFPGIATPVVVTADRSGSYTGKSTGAVIQHGNIRAVAQDAAGNRSESTQAYRVTVSISMEAISENKGNGQITITGQTRARAQIAITVPGGAKLTTTADAKGRYRVTSSNNIPSGQVSVVATLSSGISSPQTSRSYTRSVLSASTFSLSSSNWVVSNGNGDSPHRRTIGRIDNTWFPASLSSVEIRAVSGGNAKVAALVTGEVLNNGDVVIIFPRKKNFIFIMGTGNFSINMSVTVRNRVTGNNQSGSSNISVRSVW